MSALRFLRLFDRLAIARPSAPISVYRRDESRGPRVLLLATMLATSIGSARAATGPGLEWSSQPTLPIATVPFNYSVKFTTVGGPITLAEVSSIVNGSTIDLVFCVIKSTSSTAPVTVSFEIPVNETGVGTYDVRLTLLSRGEDGTQCTRPGVLGTTQTLVVPATSARTIVEYYNVPRDHYFQTADANEIALLDAGVFAGWERTGQTYRAYAPEVVTPSTPTRPVCRYYGKPELGLDTHFFSAFEAECGVIPIAFPNQWTLETDNAYAIAIPSPTTGQCAPGTLPVYRVFNGKPDVNHRYTISPVIRQQMIDAGWTPEGYGSLGVAMCAEALL